jgi:hypothetical protein
VQTSQARTAANRLNAQSSTGPRTETGKAASRQNSTTHGLSAQFAVLPHESAADFEALATALRAEFHPDGEHENFLIDQMIQARWRLARIARLENAAFQALIDPVLDPEAKPATPDARIVAQMAARPNADVLSTLQRHAAAAERTYHKCFRELVHGRQLTQRMNRIALDNHIKTTLFAAPPANGFVSQTPPTTPTATPQSKCAAPSKTPPPESAPGRYA